MTVRSTSHDHRPLRSTEELTELWRSVLAGQPFRERVVWLLFLDHDSRPVGTIVTLDNLPDGPYGVPPADLVSVCSEILDGPGTASSVVLLLSRPGAAPWTVSDRAWGRFLSAAAADLSAGWPVHWAHRRAVEVFVLP